MRRAIPCLAAAALLCFGAAPAHAQSVSPEHANDLLSLGQRQAIAEIRRSNRADFFDAANVAEIFTNKTLPDGTHIIKPLAEWTQADFVAFRYRYESAPDKNIYSIAARLFFERRAGDLSGDHESSGGGGGGEND